MHPKKLKQDMLKNGLSYAQDTLFEFAKEMVHAFSYYNYMPLAEYEDMKRRIVLKEQRKRLFELKRRKWIETKTIGNRIVARLTEQGWRQVLRDRIQRETRKCKDGVCIIIFDIPEKERFVRNLLRSYLKEWGFKKLQHSVWMTDKDILEPMMLLLQRRNLDQWIRVIKGEILTPAFLDTFRALKTLKSKQQK